MTLVIPPDKSTGCLPRISKAGEWCPLAAEKIDLVPQEDWKEYLSGIDLRAHCHVIFDQDGVGSCATESTTQSVQISRDISGQEFIQLNPWSLYYFSSGGVDRGSSIDENLRLAREQGICPESVWPRSKGWRTRPSADAMEAAKRYRIEEFYDISSIEEVGSALLCGFPVVYGWSGHSCVLTSLKSTSQAIYCNSWAPTWGDEGFGTISLAQIDWRYGAFAVRCATFAGTI